MKEYIEFLKKYLSSDPEALTWLLSYIIYVNAIDDIIDNKFDKDDKMRKLIIIRTFELALHVFSSEFYIKNMYMFFPLMKFASNSYMDSVIFEDAKEEWKRNIGDVLRNEANNIVLATIEIVSGIEKRIEASLQLREFSYNFHHTKEGLPC